jgi:hypothetical protein
MNHERDGSKRSAQKAGTTPVAPVAPSCSSTFPPRPSADLSSKKLSLAKTGDWALSPERRGHADDIEAAGPNIEDAAQRAATDAQQQQALAIRRGLGSKATRAEITAMESLVANIEKDLDRLRSKDLSSLELTPRPDGSFLVTESCYKLDGAYGNRWNCSLQSYTSQAVGVATGIAAPLLWIYSLDSMSDGAAFLSVIGLSALPFVLGISALFARNWHEVATCKSYLRSAAESEEPGSLGAALGALAVRGLQGEVRYLGRYLDDSWAIGLTVSYSGSRDALRAPRP